MLVLPSNKAFLTPTTVIWLLTLFFFLSFPKRHKFEKTSDILEVWIRTTELHCQYCAILTFMELWFSNNSIMLINIVQELHYRTSSATRSLSPLTGPGNKSVKSENTVNWSLRVSWLLVCIIYLSIPSHWLFLQPRTEYGWGLSLEAGHGMTGETGHRAERDREATRGTGDTGPENI